MSFQFNFVKENAHADEATTCQNGNDNVKNIINPPKIITDLHFDDQFSILCERVSEISDVLLFKRHAKDLLIDIVNQQEDSIEQNPLLVANDSKTDLIKGIYEGGSKTWECSIDLVNFIKNNEEIFNDMENVLELGCGSSLPGIYFSLKFSPKHFAFQDYNEEVLRHVTIPNLLINLKEGKKVDDMYQEVSFNKLEANDLISKFTFLSGDWDGLENFVTDKQFDLILSSETIYDVTNYNAISKLLVKLLSNNGFALFSCKSLYFGCSGTAIDFTRYINECKGENGEKCLECTEIWSSGTENSSLKRCILKINKIY